MERNKAIDGVTFWIPWILLIVVLAAVIWFGTSPITFEEQIEQQQNVEQLQDRVEALEQQQH